MNLTWIELRSFRNHHHTKLSVPPGVVTVTGENGAGKTNLLEAVAFLTQLESPRTTTDRRLVRDGEPAAYIRGEIQTAAEKLLIEIEIQGEGANRAQVNRMPVRRKRDLRRRVRSVFSGPEDLELVVGDPAARRRFLNQAAGSLWPARDGPVRSYERALRQRNRLLKQWEGWGEPPGLEPWDRQLVELGTALIGLREETIRAVAAPASAAFRELTGCELQMLYQPCVVAERFWEQLQERREDELRRRTSLVGPHRDELELRVRDLEARGFASHGEAWAAAISLRLGLAAALELECGEPPMVLADDPFAALDPVRRTRLPALLAGGRQTLISATDERDAPPRSALWTVERGVVAVKRSGQDVADQ